MTSLLRYSTRVAAIAALLCGPRCFCQDNAQKPLSIPIGKVFSTKDTIARPDDPSADALECLNGLCWKAEAFDVRCEAPVQPQTSALLRYPSAKPVQHEQNDLVAVEWYAVTNEGGKVLSAPAMVVVHESGRGMTVGRMVARGLRDRGIHAFMVQLPFYGLRRPPNSRSQDLKFAQVMSQGIADVRRALDAVKVLPGIESDNVSLQGTSLGGFLAATTSGIDAAYQNVFVLLAGGDLPGLILTGKRETAQLREMLEKQGFTRESMRTLLNRFEPNRLAHRIPAERLWVYSGNFDTVVPPIHADSFGKAAGLADDHHVRMPATHYSGLIFLPMILDQIATQCGGVALLETKLP